MRTRTFIRKLRKTLLVLNLLLLFGCVAAVGLIIGGLVSVNRVLPNTTQVSEYRPKLNTVLYAKSGEGNPSTEWTPIARVYRDQYRDPIRLRDVPRWLHQATVAVEDRRFWRHQGIDPWGMARALWADIRRGKASQGASTITQQLARSIWLSREKTIARKAKEVLLAVQMERKFSKDEILEMYLNEVYYGHGAYGVAAAAEVFYGKSVDQLDELTLAQCALLAGLPQRPGANSPFDHPNAAKRRRDIVLDAMVRSGYVTGEQAAEAETEQVQRHLVPRKSRGIKSQRSPYFAAEVIKSLSDTWGEEVVYGGGLRVYTTLDMRLQRIAEDKLGRYVESLRGRKVTQGALVCMDVHTGGVLAMVGGVGPYVENQWNRATHRRPVGSAFKPYVYTTALMYGWGPNSTISGANLTVPLPDGTMHVFNNYEGGGQGTYTLTSALAWSINCAAVRLLREVGVDPVVRTAAKMTGVPEAHFSDHRGLSLALGTVGFSPLEMATGYSVIASEGTRPAPTLIDRVTDSSGERLRVEHPAPLPVLHRDVAVTMRKMMEAVVRRGTAAGTRDRLGVACAGKTGTNEDWRDAWFVGFTPDLCTAVWVGRDDYGKTNRVTGASGALPIWRSFMAEAIKIRKPEGKFPEGGAVVGTKSDQGEEDRVRTVLVCTASHMLAGPYCPETEERTLAPDEIPREQCRVHFAPAAASSARPTPAPPASPSRSSPPGASAAATVSVTICVDSNRLATEYCPRTRTDNFPAGGAPTGSCRIHGSPPEEGISPGASPASAP